MYGLTQKRSTRRILRKVNAAGKVTAIIIPLIIILLLRTPPVQQNPLTFTVITDIPCRSNTGLGIVWSTDCLQWEWQWASDQSSCLLFLGGIYTVVKSYFDSTLARELRQTPSRKQVVLPPEAGTQNLQRKNGSVQFTTGGS